MYSERFLRGEAEKAPPPVVLVEILQYIGKMVKERWSLKRKKYVLELFGSLS